jgi:peroxiredoxin
MRSVLILLAFGAVAVGLYLGLHKTALHNAPPPQSHGQAAAASAPAAAPELSLTDLRGDALHTANYKGKVVLVNFWAAWCTPCAEEVPQFIALQKKYQDQGLQVIGFSVEDDATELRNFYHKYQMNYPVIPSDLKIADAFGGVLGLPTTFVIGRDSKIHGKHNGATNFAALEEEVVALLKIPQS